MTKKKRAALAVTLLEQAYPDASCSLDYSNPLELLIATRLSAQCTDARVNIVTKDLFKQFKSVDEYANAKLSDVEQCIKSCGLYKTKAKDIIALSKMLIEEYNGQVPSDIDELTKLPGIGRKTANLIMGDIYGQPAYVCDTHCIRITNLLGLTTSTNAMITERELRACLAPESSNDFCHRMVLHGRAVCKARSPQCHSCPIIEACSYGTKLMIKKQKEEAKTNNK